MAQDAQIAAERAAVEAQAALYLASSPEAADKLVAVLILHRLIKAGFQNLQGYRDALEVLSPFIGTNDGAIAYLGRTLNMAAGECQ